VTLTNIDKVFLKYINYNKKYIENHSKQRYLVQWVQNNGRRRRQCGGVRKTTCCARWTRREGKMLCRVERVLIAGRQHGVWCVGSRVRCHARWSVHSLQKETVLLTRRECEILCRVDHALTAEEDGTVCGVRRWRPGVRSSGEMAGKGVWVLRGGRDAVWEGGGH
jgi:hypothetical protein